MLYRLNNGNLEKIGFDALQGGLTLGMITLDELRDNLATLGFDRSTLTECINDNEHSHFRTGVDVYDDYFFGILNIVDAKSSEKDEDCIGMYIKKDMLLLVDILDKDGSTKEIFDYVARRFSTVTLEKLIYCLFERLTYRDSEALEELEYEVTAMEERITCGNTDRDFNADIMHLKKRLLRLRSYYEQLIDIGEELQENENGLFQQSDLYYFRMFVGRIDRLSDNVQMLRDSLVQVREAYQAALDYSLNRIMKLFTVVTTVFLPLTLITGWYGMNFTTMPELAWKYGYIFVIALSAGVAITCLVLFKKKKLL